MLSKSGWRARTAILLLLLLSGCRSALPWTRDTRAPEVNLAFTLERNLIYLTTAEINGHRGRYFLASASPRTVFDPVLAGQLGHHRGYRLQLNQRESLPISPVVSALGDTGDALIGAEVWGPHAVTIDYRSGLISYQKDGIYPSYMTLFSFEAEPMILVEINGRKTPAIVDTSSPDTLVLPGAAGREKMNVAIAGTHFGVIDVATAPGSRARVGNRLLSKFLVTIDYGRHQVGLWRDPRIPL